MDRTFLSPKDLAQAIGVSESSLKRWTDEGRLQARRTAGGHRRIELAEAVRFIRESRVPVMRPEKLGFPELRSRSPQDGAALVEALFDALVDDDARSARSLILSAFLDGASLATICDGPIRGALLRIGDLWRHSERGLVIEHRAVDICLQSLYTVRAAIPDPPEGAPVALGGAIANDPYLLPSLMVATALAEAGYHEVNLGADAPTAAIVDACAHYAPGLVWRTASIETDGEALRRDLQKILDATHEPGTRIVVGGRGVQTAISGLERVDWLDSISALTGFARGLVASRTSSERAPDPGPAFGHDF
jgi:excisionase family DNA binding protein